MRTLEIINLIVIFIGALLHVISLTMFWKLYKEKMCDNVESDQSNDDSEKTIDHILQEYAINMEAVSDDSRYDANILKRMNESRINIYYSNYTSSNVLVKGRKFGERSIEIFSTKSTTDQHGVEEKSISAWEDTDNYGIRYAIRIVVVGTNFLIWGDDREDAMLNLIAFAAEFESNYA